MHTNTHRVRTGRKEEEEEEKKNTFDYTQATASHNGETTGGRVRSLWRFKLLVSRYQKVDKQKTRVQPFFSQRLLIVEEARREDSVSREYSPPSPGQEGNSERE